MLASLTARSTSLVRLDPRPLTAGQTNNRVDAGIKLALNIGSLVWFDANNDGTNNNAEVGISGVPVTLVSVDTNAHTTTVVGTR